MSFGTLAEYLEIVGSSDAPIHPEEQGSDYEAALIDLADGTWRARTARITPTKPGAFVAVWRRAEDGGTEPFPITDPVQGLLVFVSDAKGRGVFRFTREALRELGICASTSAGGKRGFRLYPPWSAELNRQATRTQQAQSPYFHSY